MVLQAPQPEISPYLYQFLLAQTPGAKKDKKTTTAGLRPGAVKAGLFAKNTVPNADAFSHLQTIANGLQATRQSADTMYGIKLQKQQQAAAELAYKQQQAALQKQLIAIAKKNQQVQQQNQQHQYVPSPSLPHNAPGGGNGTIPNGGSAQTVLPPIVASGQDKHNADMNQWACDKYGACPPGYSPRTHIIAPEQKSESLLDKLKGLF